MGRRNRYRRPLRRLVRRRGSRREAYVGLGLGALLIAGISSGHTGRKRQTRPAATGPAGTLQHPCGDQVSTPEPGDLVFFAGVDGTPSDPGHVGLVVNPAKHLMIDAYAAGFPVRYDTYGLPESAEGAGRSARLHRPHRGHPGALMRVLFSRAAVRNPPIHGVPA